MSDQFSLSASVRTDIGKGASRRLRRNEDNIPAIIYGGKNEPMSLTIAHKDIIKALENEAFYSHILTIDIDGKKEKAVLKAIQRHPYKPKITHLDLMRVTEKQVIHMHVPLHFLGEDVAPGVKQGGIVSHHIKEVEISCPANALPEFIEIDLSEVEMDGVVHLSDLKLPKNVTLTLLQQNPDNDQPVAAIHKPKMQAVEEDVSEEETAEAAAGEEAAAEAEGDKAEGTAEDKGESEEK